MNNSMTDYPAEIARRVTEAHALSRQIDADKRAGKPKDWRLSNRNLELEDQIDELCVQAAKEFAELNSWRITPRQAFSVETLTRGGVHDGRYCDPWTGLGGFSIRTCSTTVDTSAKKIPPIALSRSSGSPTTPPSKRPRSSRKKSASPSPLLPRSPSLGISLALRASSASPDPA